MLLFMEQQKEEERIRWRGLLSEQQESGKSIAGFCRDHGLPVWQFYEWKKRLRSAKAEPFVAVEVVASEAVRAIAYEEFDPPGDRWRPPVKSHQLIF